MKVVPFDGDLDAPAAEVKASAVVPFDGALDPGPDTTASDDAMRAGDPMGIVAQEQFKAPTVTGSVFDNQDQGGPRMDAPTNDAAVNERALDNARKANPDIDKSPMYSTGAAREKANALVAKGAVAQDKAEAERTKSSGNTAQDIALNVLGGFGGTVNKAGATISQAVGAEDAEAAFDSAAEMYKKMQADNGGGMLPGKVAGFVGSVAPAIAVGAVLPAAEAYVLLSNAGLFALPAFRDTLKEKLAAGQDFPLALAHASQSFGLNLFLPNIASKGGALLNNAAGKGIIGNAASAAAEGAGFSAATTVLDKGTDLVAGEKNQKDWLDFEDMGTMALGFGAMRGIHGAAGAAARGVSAGLDRVGSPSQQFGRALGQDVDAAGFNRAQPANLNPNLRDVVPKAADPVAEIFKTGSVEEAAAAAARAADIPVGEDTAAAMRSARPMRPKAAEPTEGATDVGLATDVSGVPASADPGRSGDTRGGLDADLGTGSPESRAGVEARGGERAPEARNELLEPAAGDAAAVARNRALDESLRQAVETNFGLKPMQDGIAAERAKGQVTELKTAPYSETERKQAEDSVAVLNAGLEFSNADRSQSGKGSPDAPAKVLAGAPTSDMLRARTAGRILGVPVVFIEPHEGFNGVAIKGTAYISPNEKHPVIAVAGHEVLHGVLQGMEPQRVADFRSIIDPYLRPDAVDAKEKLTSSREKAGEEVIADLNGSMWLDPKFWQQVREFDPHVFRQLVYRFMEMAAKVHEKLGKVSRFQADRFTGDVDKVRTILADLTARAAKREGVEKLSPRESEELGIRKAKPEAKPESPKEEPAPKGAADEAAARGQEPMFSDKKAEKVDDALDELTRSDLEDSEIFSKPLPDANDPSLDYVAKIGGVHLSVKGEGVRDAGPHEFFFHDNKDQPLGYARLTKNAKQASINMIALKDDARGQGIAKAFYKYLLDDLGVSVKSDKEITEGTANVYRALAKEYAADVAPDGRVILNPKDQPKFARKPEAEKPRKPGEVTREEARQMGDLRKKVKVLESLLECLAG